MTSGSRWRNFLLDYVAELRQREGHIFLVLASVIGALTGLAVVAFMVLTERMGMRLYPVGVAPWRRVLFPVVGSLGTGYLLYRYFPNARGSGVPQTKAALFAREGRISVLCLARFLHVGNAGERNPVGPRRAIGSSWRGHWLGAGTVSRLRPRASKESNSRGTAAAIAAAFNTPLAAVLFSLEEIMGDLHAPVIGAVVLTWWIAAYALVFGVAMLVLAFRLRGRRHDAVAPSGAVPRGI